MRRLIGRYDVINFSVNFNALPTLEIEMHSRLYKIQNKIYFLYFSRFYPNFIFELPFNLIIGNKLFYYK